MIDVVGVSFEGNDRIYYFSPTGLNLNKNVNVVVETKRGLQFGKVIIPNTKLKKSYLNLPLEPVIRKTTKEDYFAYKKNMLDSERALYKCRNLIKKHNLEMRLIDANFTLDRKQLLIRFTADNRVDFRALAKELASIYKTRIELRQMGIRDKAREVGGIGPCGRMLCCARFLYYFDSVSINMAKNQNIALNPSKINGSCGRLLCCLTYENDEYLRLKKGMPEVGDEVKTKEGKGKVISIDILNQKYRVEVEKNGIITVEANKVNDEVR